MAEQSSNHEEQDHSHQVAPGIAYKRLAIVNVAFIGRPGAEDRGWVLVDAGLSGTAWMIARAAEERYGEGARPAAIVLTHGHFDHVGALAELAERWDVDIYAHELEHPYLTGRSAYAPPDPTVGGGLMSALSRFYPRGPIDVSDRLRSLPDDGSVPGMANWRWISTPGHSPGHVAFWCKSDRSLIAGDAFITTRQESAYAVALQRPGIHGPPMYYTPDWDAARASVRRLAALEPELVVAGHGPAMEGEALREGLRELASGFDHLAMPERGRYVSRSTRAEGEDSSYAPPP